MWRCPVKSSPEHGPLCACEDCWEARYQARLTEEMAATGLTAQEIRDARAEEAGRAFVAWAKADCERGPSPYETAALRAGVPVDGVITGSAIEEGRSPEEAVREAKMVYGVEESENV